MKQALILDETVVKKTIEDAMVSDKGQQFWEKLFKDPEFSSKFAKSMGKEQTQLMKTLLKDPEYQAGVIEIMKNPEVEKMMLQTMKSKEYRQYLQQVLTETAESPLFQAKMIDIISKGVQKLKKADLVRKKQAVTVVLKARRRKNSKNNNYNNEWTIYILSTRYYFILLLTDKMDPLIKRKVY